MRPPRGVRRVALLGTDGSGKSSVLRELKTALQPGLRVRTVNRRPGIVFRRLADDGDGTIRHHMRPAHGALKSAAKLVALALDWHLDHWLHRLIRKRPPGVAIFDRHYHLDVAVDPIRYRIGGPAWIPRVVLNIIPLPDLVILLDAPAEVLQSRKQELPLAETARQREAYLRLVRGLPNGHVVDASRPLNDVVAEVCRIVGGAVNTPAPDDGRSPHS